MIFVICVVVVAVGQIVVGYILNPEYIKKYGFSSVLGETLLPALLIVGIPYLIITRVYSYIKKREKNNQT